MEEGLEYGRHITDIYATTYYVCVLEDSNENVSKTELHNVCTFYRRLKEAVGEQNSHIVNLGRNIVGNQGLMQILTHHTGLKEGLTVELRGRQTRWEEGT